MERLIGWWVNNPVAANLLMIGILLSGVIGIQVMEREAFPLIKANQVTISIVWPGAAPQEVEEQIIVRIEQSLENVDQIHHVSSTATEGYARIDVATFPKVDINGFLNDVKNAVDSTPSLPRDIENPRIQRVEFRSAMIRLVVHGNISERELSRLAEDLKDELASLPHIATINLAGTREEEVTIELSEAAMRRYGLSFAEVASAIRSDSINLSSGRVRTETGDVQLRARNLANTQVDFERIVIRQSSEGAVVRVADVATVIDGFEDEEVLATMNGQPAVQLHLLETDSMQVVKASNEVRQWLKQRQSTLPEGVELSMWYDSADIYNSRMDLISKSAYMGLVLVFAILILSLRPMVALWVTGGIAVAFIGTFSLLPANDVSMNVMSSFAFLLVLGIVVDDAIVVGESIHHHAHTMGGGPEAAIAGAYAVSRPVIFAVLTTMIAFAPWLFVSGEITQMTRQISIVITVALSISLIEAFFILPSHLRHVKPRKNLTGLARRQQLLEHGILKFADRRYRPILDWALAHRYLTTSIFAGFFIISIGIFSSGWVRFFFFPQVEAEQIFLTVSMPTGTPFPRSLLVLEQLEKAQMDLAEEVNSRAKSGDGSGKLIDGLYTRTRRDNVIAIVRLAPAQDRDLSAKETAQRLRALVGDIPDAEEIEINYTLDHHGADVTYLLRHRNIEQLNAASRDLQARLGSYDSTFFVRDSQRGETDELILNLKPGAEKLGITLADASRQVRQAYYGEEVQRLPRSNGDVKVMVKYPRESRRSLASLSNFRVRTSDGREVPLMSVVEVELASGVQRIQRRDGERIVFVKADMSHQVMGDIMREIDESFLPELRDDYPGLEVGMGGQQEKQAEFFTEILALYAVALFSMYALIAVAFHSYWLPLLVMTAIPFGFMGAIYGHLLFGIPMAMFSWFGIGAAAGVVVNDNLVLVDYIGRLREEGKHIHKAIVDAGVNRFRPILLTTVTTFVGLLPIMAEQSTNAEFLKPAVIALAFGVLFALFVTLFMVPSLYAIGGDCGEALSRLKARGSGTPAQAARKPDTTEA